MDKVSSHAKLGQTKTPNIYRSARLRTGLTVEAWAEKIGCAPDTVYAYESGERTPSNYMVREMMIAADYDGLAYLHIMRTAGILDVLPTTDVGVPLPQAAIRLINRVLAFADSRRDKQLLQIAEDGVVSDDERVIYNDILEELEDIIAAAYQVRYADEEGGGRI